MAGLFGLFDYNKEGPGVAKNGPQKRPFVVFFEIYARKFWKLALAGILWTLVNLPLFTRGLADAGLTFISRNFAREKHAFIREDFFESIKKNWKIALPIGIINTLVTGVLLFNVFYYLLALLPEVVLLWNPETTVATPASLGTFDYVIIAVTLMGYATFTWMKYYIPFLMITFKLTKKQIYKNAFLFACANLPVNLLISVVLIAVYALLGGIVLLFAEGSFGVTVLALVLLMLMTVVPGFRSLLIQFCIFPAIKRLIIDPYYKENPGADKQLRLNLNLEVEEEEETASEESAPAEEPVFVDTVPEPEENNTPKKALPKQYNEKEMRRFNRQVQSRNATDDDDDTI